MSIAVRDVTKYDSTDQLAELVDEAFEGDDFVQWMRQDKEREAQGAESLKAMINKNRRTGVLKLAINKKTDDIVGLAIWIKPHPKNAKKTWTEWISEWLFWLRNVWIAVRYGSPPPHMLRFRAVIGSYFERHYTEEKGYWNLHILAVKPGYQGKGVSRLLVDPILAEADKTSTVAYLESSKKKPNIGIYERFGFRQMDELIECPSDNGSVAVLYPMRREPRPVN